MREIWFLFYKETGYNDLPKAIYIVGGAKNYI